MKQKRITPIKIPYRKGIVKQNWFAMLEALNQASIAEAKYWQEKGQRKVSGYAVMNPKGELLPSTFSVRSSTAKKRCLEPALHRFNGIICDLFSDWEEAGYKLVKVKWELLK